MKRRATRIRELENLVDHQRLIISLKEDIDKYGRRIEALQANQIRLLRDEVDLYKAYGPVINR